MSQIEISCIGSDAVFTNTPNIFSGGNVDTVKFTFNSDWDNFTTKTAVFYNNPKETSLQVLNSNNVATIPANMISQKGKLSIGVIGTNANNKVKTSKILTYIVGKGAVTDDLETTSATPDIWLQMLSIVSHNKDIVDNMSLIVDESQLTNKANKDLSNVSNEVYESSKIARITYGKYTGTGTYGIDNQNTLTFTFKPKMLYIVSGFYSCIVSREMTNFNGGTSGSLIDIILYWGSNTVSWYSTGDASKQLNFNNTTYYYVCIG